MLQDILVFLFAEDYAREVRTHSLDDRERMVIVDILPEQKEDQVIDPPIPPPKLRLYPFALALTLGVLILFSSFGLVSFILMMISMRNADGQSPVNSSSGLPPMVHTD